MNRAGEEKVYAGTAPDKRWWKKKIDFVLGA